MIQQKEIAGLNAGYLAELYERYLKDPNSVSPQVREFFESGRVVLEGFEAPRRAVGAADARKVAGLLALVRAIREQGHLCADLDPLGLRGPQPDPASPESHGLSDADLRELPAHLVDSVLAEGAESAAQVVDRLKGAYCGRAGYEFGHIGDAAEQEWLRAAVESGEFVARLDEENSKNLLERLTQVEVFERFLHRSFPGQKWFSLEGNDVLVPMLDEVVWESARSGMGMVTLGMAHRGRLNVLTHVLDKPYRDILAEFAEGHHADGAAFEDREPGWMLDVKYHLGARRTLPADNRNGLTVALLPNPSHLEMVTPVVHGATRASQEQDGREGGPPRLDYEAAMSVVMHGDAGFAGQGIVAESFNLSRLPGYSTGGSLHILVNNQLGFTTEPEQTQSTRYATDLVKGYEVPVVHVNADDPEACLSAVRLAVAYRQRFHKDFVIDLIGYRRYGHNEGDEPSFTQPVMYQVIRDHPTARAIWANHLVQKGVVSEEEASEIEQGVTNQLRRAMESLSRSPSTQPQPWRGESDASLSSGREAATGVPKDTLVRLNEELHQFPEGFTLHPKLSRPFQRRREALGDGGRIDWAHAEILALASILAEGTPVRLTGQDTERGTFSQRHSVLHDTKTNERYVPLQSMPSARAPFSVYNSPLTEAGVVGYEYGYSTQAGDSLVLWEAQFGDFINNAQGVVDEFVVSARAKWGQTSGLVLLLPHGYEGQGPNHSSSYLERFLQLSAEGNIRVAYCTTVAQYFHLLRRQARTVQTDPRPLVVMAAKSLLRHPLAASTVADLSEGRFQPVIDDRRAQDGPESVRRVILCSGKVFVDLVTSEDYAQAEDVAAVRVEELYPFPSEEVASVLARYHNAREVVWLQEEPQNRGAWDHVAPLLRELLSPNMGLMYAGRPALPSAAEGSSALHKAQQGQIIRYALSGTGNLPAAAQGVTDGR